MSISFNEISVDIRTPGVYAEILAPQTSGSPLPREVVHFTQKLAGGTQPSGVALAVSSEAQAAAACGVGSLGALMAKAHFTANKNVPLTIVPLDDNGAGVAATATVTITGSATAAGVLTLYIAGEKVEAAVTAGDAPTAVAASIVAAVAAKSQLPVSASAAVGVVTLTAKNKGEVGNDIDVRMNYGGEMTPTGLSVAIVAMASGAANPDVATAIAAIPNSTFIHVVTPWRDSTNLAAIELEAATRFNAMVDMPCLVFIGVPGTYNELLAYVADRNSPFVVNIPSNSSPDLPCVAAAIAAAINAGESDPARPRQTLPLPGLRAPAAEDRFDRTERNQLLLSGMSTTYVDAGGIVRIERLITNYTNDALGLPDYSMSDVTTIETGIYIRFSLKVRIAQRFPRHKLVDDGTRFNPGQAVATPSMIRAEAVGLFAEFEGAALVENFDQFKKDLIVTRSVSDRNRVDIKFPPDYANQLRVTAAQIAPIL